MADRDEFTASSDAKNKNTATQSSEIRPDALAAPLASEVALDFSLLPADAPTQMPPEGERFRAKTQANDNQRTPLPEFSLNESPLAAVTKRPIINLKEIGLAFLGKMDDLPQPQPLTLATFIVVALVFFLPVLYMSIVGLVAYATIVFAIIEFETVFYSLAASAITWYLLGIIAGTITVLYLVKPIFARPVEDVRPLVLDPKREPYITEFVHQIAQTLGAPEPSSIQVDAQVRVAAGFHSGIWSMLQNKLVLSIGMPIVCGCNLRQLAGMVAHGLVHFDRGMRMRLHYMVRDINAWFERAATQRDAFDMVLDEHADQSTLLKLLNIASRNISFLVRRLLALFMLTGRFLSAGMLREMESLADRYAALIAGTDAYTDTITRLQELEFAFQRAMKQVATLQSKHQLIDDFPRFVTHLCDNLTPDERRGVHIAAVQQRPTPFDTTLTDRERLAQVQSQPVLGVLSWNKPAAILFRDFDILNKHVSVRFYRSVFGITVDPKTLLPLSRIVTQLAETEEEAQARDCYLPSPLSTLDFPLYLRRVADAEFAALSKELCAELTQPNRHPKTTEMATAYALVCKRRDSLLAAATLLRSGVAIDSYTLELPESTLPAVTLDERLAAVENELSTNKNHFASWVQSMSRRLSISLTLLEDIGVCDHIDRDRAIEDRNRLLDAYRLMVKLVPTLRLLRAHHTQLEALITAPAATHHDMLFQPTLTTIVKETNKLIQFTLDQLRNTPFPLENGTPGVTLRDVIVERFPHSGGFTDSTTIAAAQAAIITNHTAILMNRILGRLAILGRSVEVNVLRRTQQKIASP